LKISSYQHYFFPVILTDEVYDALVFLQAVGAELGHGAQDEDLVIGWFGAGGCACGDQPGEVFDSGAHAGGVGVIGVEDDMVAVVLDELAAAVAGGIRFEGCFYSFVGDLEMPADRHGDEDVGQVVVADELGVDGRAAGYIDGEKRACGGRRCGSG